MFCPECKCEYKEGITICPDCKLDLVVELTEDMYDDEMTESEAFMEAYDDSDESDNSDLDSGIYVSKSQMAEDNKTSGYAMTLVGGVGLIVMILVILGIIPLNLFGNGKYLSYGVMIIMFVIFLVVGIKSLINTKKYEKDAKVEENLKQEVIDWFVNSFSAEEIDSDSYKIGDIDDLSDADKYYKRISNIKDKIKAKYFDLDPALLDFICENIYEIKFESEQ